MSPAVAIMAILLLVVSGCRTSRGPGPSTDDSIPPQLSLAPGDVVEVVFPNATNLNSVYRIGPEGTITLPVIGPVQAAGLTSDQLQGELVKLFENELKESNVIVSVADSANAVYVTGSVLRPGKIPLKRPLTALESIMETGGFSPRANPAKVTIVRYVGDTNTIIELDLEPVMVGEPVPPFYVKPRDIIHVPEKIQWF